MRKKAAPAGAPLIITLGRLGGNSFRLINTLADTNY